MFNSKLLKQIYFLNLNAMNKIKIGYEHLQNDYKIMQPFYNSIALWGHIVIGLFEVVRYFSQNCLCEILFSLQSNVTII